ncbi:MAG TPA: hypothetical protein VHA76_06195 [Solirubrobacterales bacterium]|nr:hypothetical protein [Solirubrobacterales bacterium]
MTSVTQARRRLPALLVAAFALLAGGAFHAPAAGAVVPNPDPGLISRWEPCEPNTGVTVIVDFQGLGNHDIKVGCALGEQGSGDEALVRAGFTIAGTDNYGLNFICRIDELPTVAEQSCHGTPGATAYWEYWHGKPGGQWEFSGEGAGQYQPRFGSVEGWGFARRAEPGTPSIRIPPQDGRGATLELPAVAPSSAIQLRLAQEWLVRRLEALAPAGGGGSTTVVPEVVSYAAALARTGYPLTGARFAGARELLTDPTTAWRYSFYTEQGQEPRPEVMGPYAIALGALEGGAPLLDDGTNMRVWLLEDVEAGTGKVEVGRTWKEDGRDGGFVLEALARTGALSGKATALIEMIERSQESDGSFQGDVESSVAAMRGLLAAERSGAGDLSASIGKLAAWVAGLQEADGGVRQNASGEPKFDPDFGSTAAGALILALGGEEADAVKAAQWISPYQVTAELAGGGPNSTTGGPGSPDVGAFAASLGGLREVILYGVGPLTGVVESTPPAAEALAVAPWLDPVPASVSAPFALSIGSDHALIAGTLEVGTSNQSLDVEYGTTTSYGSVAVGPTLVAELGETPVEIELTGLEPGTTYHARLVAIGPLGEIVRGADSTFTTLGGPPSADAGPLPVPGPGGTGGGGAGGPGTGKATFRSASARQSVGRDRTVSLGTIGCPAGVSCTISAPARVKVRIARETYWATVLAPRSLAGGRSATVRVRLPKPALRALAGGSVVIVVPVTVSSRGGKRTLRAKVRVSRAEGGRDA